MDISKCTRFSSIGCNLGLHQSVKIMARLSSAIYEDGRPCATFKTLISSIVVGGIVLGIYNEIEACVRRHLDRSYPCGSMILVLSCADPKVASLSQWAAVSCGRPLTSGPLDIFKMSRDLIKRLASNPHFQMSFQILASVLPWFTFTYWESDPNRLAPSPFSLPDFGLG